jgi:hypothetical protein
MLLSVSLKFILPNFACLRQLEAVGYLTLCLKTQVANNSSGDPKVYANEAVVSY